MNKLDKIKERAQKDYYFLAKEILGFTKMSEEPHQELCDHITKGKRKRKLTLMPRGSFKSSVVTVAGSIFRIINNPNIRILVASETQKNATKYVGEIKEHFEKNIKLNSLFGDWRGSHWRSYEFVVSKRTEFKKECTVTASSLEKGLQTGMHYDCVILDDVVSQSNINTQEQLEKTQTFYKLLLSILDPGGELWVNGTRWSIHDLYGYLLDPKNGESELFDVMVRKAIQEDGTLLMPKVLTEQFLKEQKTTQGDWIFSCQYLNEAHTNTTSPFKKEWMQVYKTNPKGLIFFITCDLAVAKTRDADYIAIIVNGVDHRGNWYIQEALQLKITLPELIDMLFSLTRIYKPLMCVAFQKFSLEKALQDFLIPEMDKRKEWFPIKEVPTDSMSSKKARIKGLQPKFRNREVFLKEEHVDLYKQLIFYPQVEHDDLLDALKDQMAVAFCSDYRPDKKEESALTQNEIKAWSPLKEFGRRKVKETKIYV